MRNLKKTRYFLLGRKWVFTLALFLLVFAAASVVKIQAAGNVTGWLWGGGAESDGVKPWDGSNTNVRWISINSDNPEVSHAIPYGVSIPSSDGNVTGYAWSGGDDSGPGLGWIDFNPNGVDGIQNTADDHCTTGSPSATQYRAASCVAVSNCGSPGVKRVGDNIEGCARIVEIAKASAVGNSGGWEGWLKVKGSTYGVKISMMDGAAKDPSSDTAGTAGANELGWVDFSRAKYEEPCTPLCGSAVSQTFCAGDPGPSSNLCAPDQGTPSAVSGSGPWSWTCDCGGSSVPCTAGVTSPEDGQCGTADGGSFCSSTPTDAELCAGGTHPSVSLLDFDSYEVTWTCTGVCSTVNDTCSAKGKKACGWIETNP